MLKINYHVTMWHWQCTSINIHYVGNKSDNAAMSVSCFETSDQNRWPINVNDVNQCIPVFPYGCNKRSTKCILCHWKLLLTSGTQKAIPHPLGSSRSHPAPHEFISCPTCLPGCCTSRMGTRPCSGVGLNLEPGTSTSLRLQFNSCR